MTVSTIPAGTTLTKLLQDLTRLVDVDDTPPQDVSDLVAIATENGAW